MESVILLSLLLTGACGQLETPEISGSIGPALPHEYPFMVRLQIRDLMCGASLISPRFLASAYHCFFSDDFGIDFDNDCIVPGTCYAVIREHDLTKKDFEEQNVTIKSIHRPPFGDSDLALVELQYPVKLDEGAKLVRVAEERLTVGDSVWSLGWGETFQDRPSPDVLQKVLLRVSRVSRMDTFTEVGRNAKGIPVDPCSGDSGGPLLKKKEGEWFLYATLYGGGYNCHAGNTPDDGKWNSLAPHKEWIQDTLSITGMATVYTQTSGELQLKKDNLLTTIPTLGIEWEISFEFKPENYDNTKYTSILHLTVGENISVLGDRIPAIFFHSKSGLHVATSLGDDPNYHKDIIPKLPLNKWSTIVVSQIKSGAVTNLNIQVAGTDHISVPNPTPQEFSTVKVYAADPWYDAQPGFIKGLIIKTK